MAKKLILSFFISIVFITSIFSSTYSLIFPKNNREDVLIMDAKGNEIYLDENIFYKRWNGLLLEGYEDEAAYTIADDMGKKVLIFTRNTDLFRMESLLRTLSRDLSAVIFFENIIDSNLLVRHAKNATIISLSDISSRDELRLERANMRAIEADYGSILDIKESTVTLRERERIEVRCPHCKKAFFVYV